MSVSRPFDFSKAKYVVNNIGSFEHRAVVAHLIYTASEATASDTDAVHSAIDCTTSKKTISSGFEALSCPRVITATAGGTAENIKAVKVKITGLNAKGAEISEELPAFTADTAGTVTGAKAFATVTKVEIPAMDGACTVEIGVGSVLGLPYILAGNTVLCTLFDGVKENTAPVVTTGAAIENNTITLNSTLAGKQIDVYLLV